MLACGLILRPVIPSLRFFVAWESKDDVLAFGALQDFRTTMNGKKSSRVLLKTGWSEFSCTLATRGSVDT
jgi:hypothetical protein